VLHGHEDQVLGMHAYGETLASCSADGSVQLWSLADGLPLRRWRWHAYCVQCDERRCLTGGEGADPIRLYDWHDGAQLAALHDAEAPQGICTALQRAGATVAASNSDRASPLRTWDLATGALTDRFLLPSFCAGVRCLQLHGHELVAGCGNGWVVLCDLRSGRWERKVALPEMVNTLEWRGDMLLTGGDDGVVRLSDVGTFATISGHRVGRCVFAARFDRTRIYAGCDNGEVRVFDYSSRPESAHAVGEGGFTPRQKQALQAAFFERPQSFGAHADVL